MLSHFVRLKEEYARSSFDLYPQVLETKQMQPRVMSSIDNKENTLNITLLDPREGSSKEA